MANTIGSLTLPYTPIWRNQDNWTDYVASLQHTLDGTPVIQKWSQTKGQRIVMEYQGLTKSQADTILGYWRDEESHTLTHDSPFLNVSVIGDPSRTPRQSEISGLSEDRIPTSAPTYFLIVTWVVV